MNAKFALGAALALLSLTTAAFAQTPAILGPAPDPLAPLRRAPLSVQEHRIPSGTPGFYDPTTRTFAPLVNENPAAALPTVSGAAIVGVAYHFSPDVHADDKVSCDLAVFLFRTPGIVQATELEIVSFRAGSPKKVISNDFSYTPQSSVDLMDIVLDCLVRSGDFGEIIHDFRIDLFTGHPTNGLISLQAQMYL